MLRVSDLKKSIDFYSKALGMTLIGTFENTQYRYTLAFLGYVENAETTIELTHIWDADTYQLGNGFGHIAIGVEEIDQAVAQILLQGGEVTRKPVVMLGGKSITAFAKDPDGFMIELIQVTKNNT